MKQRNIKLLDCTLRDGGYINNWNFGYNKIKNTINSLNDSNVDILEVGFLKKEDYCVDRTVFNNVNQITKLINKKPNVLYAAMAEVVNPIPLDWIENRANDSIDIIRVIIWKTKRNEKGIIIDALDEGFNYCKGIVEKGYKLCVQPARVDQYNDDEFIYMLNMFKKLNPYAIYIVDSWGTMTFEGIEHYANIANKVLNKEIKLGYHGHNNMMQAFDSATKFVRLPFDRDLIIDASVFGIGRGAGNLNTEIFAKYMNEYFGRNYKISNFLTVYEDVVKDIYQNHPWGYSIPYFLTAKYGCNPNYGEYYWLMLKLPITIIDTLLLNLNEEDKIIYSKEKADRYYNNYINKGNK